VTVLAALTYEDILRGNLARVEAEIARIKAVLVQLRPGVEGKIADYESELQDQLADLEDEREDVLAELNGEDEDD
jgi:hypothetical protein